MPRPAFPTASTRPLAVALLAAALTLGACDAPTAADRPPAHRPVSSRGSVGAAAFAYAVTVDGAGIHAVATADAVLGPPGTGVLGAPAPGRTGRAPGEWIPGQHRDGVFVLRGVRASDAQLLRWYAAAAATPGAARATVTIAVLNPAGHAVATWTLRDAVPTKITGPMLNAAPGEVAIEEIELAEEGLAMPCDDGDVACR